MIGLAAVVAVIVSTVLTTTRRTTGAGSHRRDVLRAVPTVAPALAFGVCHAHHHATPMGAFAGLRVEPLGRDRWTIATRCRTHGLIATLGDFATYAAAAALLNVPDVERDTASAA
jgi:hypothetical protein